jgi:hypothetical protein
MRDTIEASTETVRGRVITAADPDHDDDALYRRERRRQL